MASLSGSEAESSNGVLPTDLPVLIQFPRVFSRLIISVNRFFWHFL